MNSGEWLDKVVTYISSWKYGQRKQTGHQCRPVGQGRSMFGLIINTTTGSFSAWDEARTQLLGLLAAKLMGLNRDHCLPLEIEEKVCDGVWQLIMHGGRFRNHQSETISEGMEGDQP